MKRYTDKQRLDFLFKHCQSIYSYVHRNIKALYTREAIDAAIQESEK